MSIFRRIARKALRFMRRFLSNQPRNGYETIAFRAAREAVELLGQRGIISA